jgi:LPXTG-motif cell wall-anchored protein
VSGHRAKLFKRRVFGTPARERLLPCPEGNRHQPAPLLAYGWGWRDLVAGAELLSFVTSGSVNAITRGRARQPHTGETMDTTTLIVIVLVVLLLGGGGFFYRRRV